jgi:hypothetical protein
LGKKLFIALGAAVLLAAIGTAVALHSKPPPPPPEDSGPPLAHFDKWAVEIVSGDNHAHSGAPSEVFDNARQDLVKAFVKMGFRKKNMEQFSMNFDYDARPTDIVSAAEMLKEAAKRAPEGCLVYFTSHGAPEGIVVGTALVPPDMIGKLVNNACGHRPSVVVMSACYSGQFVPVLQDPNRVVMTAARPDRTSFGCGEADQYTFFDDCFLRAIPHADSFAALGEQVQQCVATRETVMKVSPPSEPQVSVGPNVAFTLRWK